MRYFTLHTSPFYLYWKCVCFGWLLPSEHSWLQQTHPITQTNVSFTPIGQSRQMFICVHCLVPSDIQIHFSGCKQYVSEFAGQYSSLLAVLFLPICIQLSGPCVVCACQLWLQLLHISSVMICHARQKHATYSQGTNEPSRWSQQSPSEIRTYLWDYTASHPRWLSFIMNCYWGGFVLLAECSTVP